MIRWAIALLALAASVAAADVESDADRAFRAAGQLAGAGDPRAIDAFEQLGAARPVSRWTDDAWAEAARLSENARDYARARRDLEQVIALGTDDRLVARAKGALARIGDITGGGQWDTVSAEHERLASVIYGGGDPRAALGELEALVRANPGYPRASSARLTLAVAWETEGEGARGLAWFRLAAEAAPAEPGQHVRLEYVRALVRAGQLDRAAEELAALDPALVDRAGAAQARDALATAHRRLWIRRALWILLAMLAAVAAVVARRDLGSWRTVARRLVRPPLEVLFLVPIAAVLVAIAQAGNPLAARAITAISIVGLVVAWISGMLLEAAGVRRGRVGTVRVIVQIALVVIAVGAAVYLAVDRDRMLDLLGETWHGGPARQ